MAVFHFHMKHISRGHGRSATAAAAYRAAARILDVRTGVLHDYTRKRGVADSAILAPNRAPDWARDTEQLWNAAELAEARKDARVARENVVALPHELTLEQNREWLHAFVEKAYVRRGMVCQVCIHEPNPKGDERNWHAHILMAPRRVTRNGFQEKKPRSWNDKATLNEWRALCAELMNDALARAKVKDRVDHRSLDAQGIDRDATVNLGQEATAMERDGSETRLGEENRQIADANADLADLHLELAELDAAIEADVARLQALYDECSIPVADRPLTPGQVLRRLDADRDLSAEEQRQRLKLASDLLVQYNRPDVEEQVKELEQQLGAASWWDRVSGRVQDWQDELAAQQKTLANIQSRERKAGAALERSLETQRQARLEAEATARRQPETLSQDRDTPRRMDSQMGQDAPSDDLVVRDQTVESPTPLPHDRPDLAKDYPSEHLEELDRARVREAEDRRRIHDLHSRLDKSYHTEDLQSQLRDVAKQAENASWLDRLSGKQRRLEEERERLRRDLDQIERLKAAQTKALENRLQIQRDTEHKATAAREQETKMTRDATASDSRNRTSDHDGIAGQKRDDATPQPHDRPSLEHDYPDEHLRKLDADRDRTDRENARRKVLTAQLDTNYMVDDKKRELAEMQERQARMSRMDRLLRRDRQLAEQIEAKEREIDNAHSRRKEAMDALDAKLAREREIATHLEAQKAKEADREQQQEQSRSREPVRRPAVPAPTPSPRGGPRLVRRDRRLQTRSDSASRDTVIPPSNDNTLEPEKSPTRLKKLPRSWTDDSEKRDEARKRSGPGRGLG